MYTFKVWIDGDSCPLLLRNYLVNIARTKKISMIFVANSILPLPADVPFIETRICNKTKGAADNLIFDNAAGNDIVVTRDIPFAARLVKKGIFVINDRGNIFTKDNIADRLQERDFNLNLSQIGLGGRTKDRYGEKQLAKFEDAFERQTSQLIVNDMFKKT